MLESNFQANLIKEIKERFPGCVVLKNDSSYMQGIPDISIFHKDHLAMLEVKKNKTAKRQPNQEYYVYKLNDMSYATFVYPENKNDVMNELEKRFT